MSASNGAALPACLALPCHTSLPHASLGVCGNGGVCKLFARPVGLQFVVIAVLVVAPTVIVFVVLTHVVVVFVVVLVVFVVVVVCCCCCCFRCSFGQCFYHFARLRFICSH